MSPRSCCVLASVAVLVMPFPSGLHASRADEGETPVTEEPTPEPETTEDDAQPPSGEPGAAGPGRRLILRAGPAHFSLRGSGRGRTHHFDIVPPFSLEQTIKLRFAESASVGIMADASFEVFPRWFVTADVLASSPDSGGMTDTRALGNIGQSAGDFTLAEFTSEFEPDYLEWSIGGARRVLPFKKGATAPIYIDILVQYRKAEAEYAFDAGVLTRNPFDPNALSGAPNPHPFDPNAPMLPAFDLLGRSPASYEMAFENLLAGIRIGGQVSPRISLEGIFAPTWFARYDGRTDLGPHGIFFAHRSFFHDDPVFHTPNCDSDDPDPNTPECRGLVDSDLITTGLKIRQKSSRGRGLKLDLSLDVRLKDWLGVAAGYHRQTYRSLGGSERRDFTDDAASGCPQAPRPPDPNDPNAPLTFPPRCDDEDGDLGTAALTTQSFFVVGRFRWF